MLDLGHTNTEFNHTGWIYNITLRTDSYALKIGFSTNTSYSCRDMCAVFLVTCQFLNFEKILIIKEDMAIFVR